MVLRIVHTGLCIAYMGWYIAYTNRRVAHAGWRVTHVNWNMVILASHLLSISLSASAFYFFTLLPFYL